jgi:predicted Ser/Thr protein kinase
MAAIVAPQEHARMPDSVYRSKMISFRLSQVEYEVLKKEYRTYGARNVSELARLALQRIMNGSAASHDACAAKVAELDDRVHALESQVSFLLGRAGVTS